MLRGTGVFMLGKVSRKLALLIAAQGRQALEETGCPMEDTAVPTTPSGGEDARWALENEQSLLTVQRRCLSEIVPKNRRHHVFL